MAPRDTTGGSQLVETKRVAPWRPTARRQAVVDHRLMLEAALGEAFECWDAGHECAHGHLPADPEPHICGCWNGLEVREAEALRHDIQALTKALERHHEERQREHEETRTFFTTLVEMLAHTDRNVTAVGYQVSQNGR